jgi:hypothetical protein
VYRSSAGSACPGKERFSRSQYANNSHWLKNEGTHFDNDDDDDDDDDNDGGDDENDDDDSNFVAYYDAASLYPSSGE